MIKYVFRMPVFPIIFEIDGHTNAARSKQGRRKLKGLYKETKGSVMIKDVVGTKTYSVWTNMLKRLVPYGRTHRLSVVVAGMLQVAYEIAQEKEKSNAKARKLAESVRIAFEGSEEAGAEELAMLAEELFRDAKVGFKRTSRQGQAYSIAGDAAMQFIHWDDMPWE